MTISRRAQPLVIFCYFDRLQTAAKRINATLLACSDAGADGYKIRSRCRIATAQYEETRLLEENAPSGQQGTI